MFVRSGFESERVDIALSEREALVDPWLRIEYPSAAAEDALRSRP